jgi:UDP-glucose 4-epimerase
VVGHPIRIELAARRPGDPAALVGNSKQARETLGWAPSRSALDIQIADAWNWLRTQAWPGGVIQPSQIAELVTRSA